MRIPKNESVEGEGRAPEASDDDFVDGARARIERQYRQRGLPSPFEDDAVESEPGAETDCGAAEADEEGP